MKSTALERTRLANHLSLLTKATANTALCHWSLSATSATDTLKFLRMRSFRL